MAGGTPSSSSPPTNTHPPQIPLSSTSEFPLLAPSSGAPPPLPPRSWSNIFAPPEPSSKNLDLSFHPSEPEIIPFSGEKLSIGAEDWSLCLVGYSVGRRPFYEALQKAIKKTWSLRGLVQILSLSDGHLSFSNGIPNLSQNVQYEWRPSPCSHCKSLVHFSTSCPSKPYTQPEDPPAHKTPPPRGRSVSRKPRVRLSKPPNHKPSNAPASVILPDPALQQGLNTTTTNAAGLTLHYQPHSPTHQKSNPITLHCSAPPPPQIAGKLSAEVSLTVPIPNLNSLTEDISSSSTDTSSQAEPPQPGFTSPNKFNLLMEQDISSNLACSSDASKVVKHVTTQDFSNPTNSGVPKKLTRGISADSETPPMSSPTPLCLDARALESPLVVCLEAPLDHS
ncbi:hypothetical protein M5K25_012306 [Dendrobium thyrsiflorum]|uniref:DUF4283 domain-containing protein n=1 Tax=Dendrobium thyrsiflorum TaxID=117978 RepID=A0ABD0UXB0_DENTH